MAVAIAEIEDRKPTAEEIAAFYESPTNHAQGLTPGIASSFMKVEESPRVTYRLTEPVLDAFGDVSIGTLNALRAHAWDGRLVKGLVGRTKGETLVVKNGKLDLVTAEMRRNEDPGEALRDFIERSTNLEISMDPRVLATVVQDRFWITYIEAFCCSKAFQAPRLPDDMSFISIRRGQLGLSSQGLEIPEPTRKVVSNYARLELSSGFNPISGPEIRSGT